ncbi:MAG: T9SS type A sorting domain-containing protein, partial [Bacteroidia bacterium]
GLSYAWYPIPVTTSSLVASPPNSITYSVTGTDANNCTITQAVFITVVPLPTISVTSASSVICLGNSVVLTASGAVTYTWDNGSNSNWINVTPTANTNYTITGDNGTGCLNSSVYTQYVILCTNELENVINQNVIISIYPNPNNGEFYISEFENNIGNDVEIYNSVGQLLKQFKIESQIQQIEINEYPNGFYFVRIMDGNLILSTTKIIKNN